MRNALPKIIQYYRSCYQADYRAVHLLNFFSNKVSQSLLLESAELLEGKNVQVPVPSDWGKKAATYLQLHSKEKTLYCASFFLVGRTKLLGKNREVAAPLYLHPCTVFMEQEVYYLSIEANKAVINPAFVDVLKQDQDVDQGLYESLIQDLPNEYIDFDELHLIEATLEKYFPTISREEIAAYPLLLDESQLRTAVKKQRQGYRILPALGIGIMDKASGSLGILNELQDIVDQNSFSKPIVSCFTPSASATTIATPFVPHPIRLPVTLSANQQHILQQVSRHDINLVIGPPGTGKSFTIAAIAADRLSKGESVLIAAKNLQAVNVVADKIEQDMGLEGVVVRAGKKDYRKHLRRRMQDWLHGLGIEKVADWSLNRKEAALSQRTRQIGKLENMLSLREEYERHHGQKIVTGLDSWWQRWRLYILKRRLAGILPMWDLWFKLEENWQHLHRQSKELLQLGFLYRLYRALNRHRSDLYTFLQALKSKTGQEKETLFEKVNFDRVLNALPIWVVNTADVNRVLPLKKELFDLVIIDEASQCDIASSLPLLQRAKRAVIVGDPKQLRHISFLSRAQQSQMANQLGIGHVPANKLAYRDKSLLDLVSDSITQQDQVYLLDEHFRSLPGIISFSNQQFYSNQLKIMTATPDTLAEQCVFIHSAAGKREKQGHNVAEAELLINKVINIAEAEAPLSAKLCQSIGIISPLRDQVDFIRKQLQEALSESQLVRHKLLIGTPFDFQGEERDVMFLSFAIDTETPAGVYRYLNREDVFNVGITRARAAQHLFISFDPRQLPAQHLLGRYLHFVNEQEQHREHSNAHAPEDDFMTDIVTLLKDWGIESIYKNYGIAGVEIDLVIVNDGQTYCIDLIGHPGYYEKALPMSRWKMLDRVGLKSFALPYSHWAFEREECVEALAAFLQLEEAAEIVV